MLIVCGHPLLRYTFNKRLFIMKNIPAENPIKNLQKTFAVQSQGNATVASISVDGETFTDLEDAIAANATVVYTDVPIGLWFKFDDDVYITDNVLI